METVSRALLELGKDVVARMAQEVVRGAGVVRLQFLASEFYEAVKAELDDTAALISTSISCGEVAILCRTPALVCGSHKLSMLSESPGVQPGAVVRFRPQLRVIQGGLS